MLNTKQERAAYLISVGRSYEEIVRELDIASDLLIRWLQLPHFIEVLNYHRQCHRMEQAYKLECLSVQAVKTLEEILLTGTVGEKLQAVRLILDKVNLLDHSGEMNSDSNCLEDSITNSSAVKSSPGVVEHEALDEIDETILEECLEDLENYLEGEMSLEKAKARLYPIINPSKLTLMSASSLLPAVKKQVEANLSKHLFVGKV